MSAQLIGCFVYVLCREMVLNGKSCVFLEDIDWFGFT